MAPPVDKGPPRFVYCVLVPSPFCIPVTSNEVRLQMWILVNSVQEAVSIDPALCARVIIQRMPPLHSPGPCYSDGYIV